MPTTTKALNKIHIIAMARHAGLAFQDADAIFLNDLAGEKEVLAFARLIERASQPQADDGKTKD
ncbi:hypothetical protein [Noviherbaspirillum sp. ST9]|uniref:hypothetical protein n=1 Tax=Noviherbaspirillum sp. ST9 TaxID=3401606 RepID=UPI003B58929A